jgi:hypothetical protein
MTVPTTFEELSATASANPPDGGADGPNSLDNHQRQMYAFVRQTAENVRDGEWTYLTGAAGADTITITGPLDMDTYVTGQRFHFNSAAANTGAVTLNINSIGAADLQRVPGTALAAGEIPNNYVVEVVYISPRFRLLNAYPREGTWTPTLTNVDNLSASTSALCMYAVTGRMCAVWGSFEANPVAADVTTTLRASLPITSNFSLDTDANGTFNAALTRDGGAMSGNVAGDLINFIWTPAYTTNQGFGFSGAYILK